MKFIKGVKEQGESSVPAIKEYIAANYKVDPEKVAPFLTSSVAFGVQVQTTGKHASVVKLAVASSSGISTGEKKIKLETEIPQNAGSSNKCKISKNHL